MRVDELVQFLALFRGSLILWITREAIYMWRKRPGEIVPKGELRKLLHTQGKLSLNPELYKRRIPPGTKGRVIHENQT